MNLRHALLVCCLSLALAGPLPAREATAKKETTTEAEYGLSQENPILVGSKDEFGGPAAERAYLDSLRDEAGKPIKYERRGSVGQGPDGHVVDLYSVTTSDGKTLKLYIDMYHPKNDPKKQPAPKGLKKAK